MCCCQVYILMVLGPALSPNFTRHLRSESRLQAADLIHHPAFKRSRTPHMAPLLTKEGWQRFADGVVLSFPAIPTPQLRPNPLRSARLVSEFPTSGQVVWPQWSSSLPPEIQPFSETHIPFSPPSPSTFPSRQRRPRPFYSLTRKVAFVSAEWLCFVTFYCGFSGCN